jgi:hypothetical protein
MADIETKMAAEFVAFAKKHGFSVERGHGFAAGTLAKADMVYMLSLDTYGVELAIQRVSGGRYVTPWRFDTFSREARDTLAQALATNAGAAKFAMLETA